MKYKRLSKEELEKLEKEFIDFLVVNGISAEDWVEIKTKSKDKAEDIVDQFSDVVWEASLRKSLYLQHVNNNSIYCFHCKHEVIRLIRLECKDKSINLKDADQLKIILDDPSLFTIQKADKAYSKQREQEMFDLIENGAVISNGIIYKGLA